MDDAALSRLRRWQLATVALLLVAVLGEAGIWARSLLAPPPASPRGLDRSAVDAIVREALAARPDPGAALSARVESSERALGGRLDALEKATEARLEALEKALAARAAAADAPGGGARVVRCERRSLVRLRPAEAGGVEWRALPLGAPEAGPFPSGDEAGAAPWTAVPAGERLLRIELPRPLEPLEPGILFAAAIVRAEKDVGEDAGAPNRLWLSCVEPGERRQLWDIVGQFTPARGGTRDALLKSSASTAAFAVSPEARLELVLDVESLARRLAGTLDVYVRAGPLLAVPPPQEK